MARIVEFRSSEQPHMSITESMYYRLAEPLVFRDLDGVLGDIVAACCRRCGEVTLRSDEVANHLCISSERTDRLVAKGIGVFREIVARKDTEATLAALQQRRITLTCHDCGDLFTETIANLTASSDPEPLAPLLCQDCGDGHRAAEGGDL